ncbi:hypothetical protein [Flavobacterium sp.]|uniref:hypothetical protein n=1 Tax=Flavobacterium sp. TaxID=239 RepID=UPI00286A5ED0|nr:hypothetical protein [Flavobacterium sp.]
METIKIEFQPNIKEKLMEFLNSFKSDEVHIVEEDKEFLATKNRVQQSYEKLIKGENKLYDIDELDAMLDKTISKYEN